MLPMSSKDFLERFEQALLVGGTLRKEIITEICQHTEEIEVGKSQALDLGDPEKLAQKYNHTHLGFFHTTWRLILPPGLLYEGLLLFMLVPYILGFGSMNNNMSSSASNTGGADWFWPFMAIIAILGLSLALVYCRALSKLYHLRDYILVTLVIVITLGTLTFGGLAVVSSSNLLVAFMGAFLGTIPQATFIGLFLTVGALFYRRIEQKSSSRRRSIG